MNIDFNLDDGLFVCNLKPRLAAELERKKLHKIFQDYVNVLAKNLDLERDMYKLYMKPNDVPVYVHWSPKKSKMTPNLSQNQMSELKES